MHGCEFQGVLHPQDCKQIMLAQNLREGGVVCAQKRIQWHCPCANSTSPCIDLGILGVISASSLASVFWSGAGCKCLPASYPKSSHHTPSRINPHLSIPRSALMTRDQHQDRTALINPPVSPSCSTCLTTHPVCGSHLGALSLQTRRLVCQRGRPTTVVSAHPPMKRESRP